MKFNCNGSDLAAALNKVCKAISTKKNIPILEGVMISADNDTITLTATDNEITIINKINGNVILAGDIIVDGRLACELFNKMVGQTIEIDCIDGKTANIKYLDSQTVMNCMNIEEYPVMSELEGETIEIKQNELKRFMEIMSIGINNAGEMAISKVCLLKVDGKKVTGVALDGTRMAIANTYIEKEHDYIEAVIPAKNLLDTIKVLENVDDYIKIIFTPNRIMLDIEHTKIIIQLSTIKYMNYQQALPKEFNTTVIVIKEQLEEVLGRASIFSKREATGMIIMQIEDNLMTLKAKNFQGNFIEKLPISVSGKDITMGFTYHNITECVRAINDEQIKINIAESIKPCTITPIEGDAFLLMLLPVRIL